MYSQQHAKLEINYQTFCEKLTTIWKVEVDKSISEKPHRLYHSEGKIKQAHQRLWSPEETKPCCI